ncbi:MAG: hypothetical protein U9N52_05045 [Campylobacterota bacterium]|nr:hypothetical protein [Campylobacterota bacterium]
MSMKKIALSLVVLMTLFSGCTQETQNKFSRSVQNWTGTNGVLDIYAGSTLIKRFLKVDKLSTGKGTDDGKPRAYRYGYGIEDRNFNHIVDKDERKIYFEVSTFSTYVFYENTVTK